MNMNMNEVETELDRMITENELSALIRESTSARVLELKFGPGWVELVNRASNRWAYERLAQIRASNRVETETALEAAAPCGQCGYGDGQHESECPLR